MKKLLLLLLLIVAIKLNAQDIIVKKNQDEIKSKVLEISDETIKYKKWGMLEGPTYSINAADVFMIIYQNGTREVIKTKNKTATEQVEEDQDENAEVLVRKKSSVNENENATTEKNDKYTWYPQFQYFKKKNKYKKIPTFGDFGTEIRALIDVKAINLYIHPQIFLTKNLALDLTNHNIFIPIDNGLNKITIWDQTNYFGIAYFLNSLLKIDKNKASLYVAPKIRISHGVAFGEGSESVNIPISFGFHVGFGARYHFTQKVGFHTEINTNLKSFGLNIGISVLRLKDNNLKNSLLKKKNR